MTRGGRGRAGGPAVRLAFAVVVLMCVGRAEGGDKASTTMVLASWNRGKLMELAEVFQSSTTKLPRCPSVSLSLRLSLFPSICRGTFPPASSRSSPLLCLSSGIGSTLQAPHTRLGL